MSDKSAIEWTEATWNPVRGCTKISPGCKHCYAETFAERFRGVPGHPYEQGFDLRLVPDKLDEPLRWKRPRRVFVNSMSDLFQEGIPVEFIDQVFAVMAVAHQHTFQVLTKRPERMLEYLRQIQDDEKDMHRWESAACEITDSPCAAGIIDDADWPLPNVWLGVSVENQKYADERIPLLLKTPAAVRFISAEPLLGPVVIAEWLPRCVRTWAKDEFIHAQGLDWVICGGESGHEARPMHPGWARSLRDQCQDAGVPFFFKQWGEWRPHTERLGGGLFVKPDGSVGCQGDLWEGRAAAVDRVGKKIAGRVLDGREWNEYPQAVAPAAMVPA